MKTIAQSIREATAKIADLRAKLQAAVEKMEAGTGGDDIGTEVDDLTVQAEEAGTELERLQRVQKAMGQRAEPPEDDDDDEGKGGEQTPPATGAAGVRIIKGGIKTRGADDRTPAGTLLARMAIARTIARLEQKPLDAVVERLFRGDKAALAIAKSAVGVADTTTAGWAAELVRDETRGMLITDLKPLSIWAALAAQGVLLNFNGAETVTAPSVSYGSRALAGAWVGQGGVIPVKQGNIGAKTLSRYKVAVITALTQELVRASDPNAVEVIRQLMLNDTGNALDGSMLDGLASVPGVRPAGLLNGVVVTAGDATGGQAAVVADVKAMLTELIAAGGGAKPILILNKVDALGLSLITNALGEFVYRDEVAAGRLHGIPLIVSTNATMGTAIMVDAAYFASAFDTPIIDISEQATLTLANADGAAPTQAMDNAGGLGTPEQVLPDRGIHIAGGVTGAASAGAQAVSLFQTWSLAQRLVMPATFAMLRAGVVSGRNALTWGGI